MDCAPAENSVKRRQVGSTKHRQLQIPVRKNEFPMRVDRDEVFPGASSKALFLLILSLSFPDGEQFFIDSVLHFRDRITDEDLKRQIRAFIGQEAQHGSQHRKYNRMMIRGLMPYEQADRFFKRGKRRMQKLLSPTWQLAGTAAAEHFTATLAHQLLSNPAIARGGHPDHIALWKWHAVEETEHKAVAFDVYEAVAGSYAQRVAAMAVLSAGLVPLLTAGLAGMMALDGRLFSWKDWRPVIEWTLGKDGLLSRSVPKLLDYFRPGFHPWDHDNSALIALWKAEYEAGPAQ